MFAWQRIMLLQTTAFNVLTDFVQRVGNAAIESDLSAVRKLMAVYRRRCELLVQGLNLIPEHSEPPAGRTVFIITPTFQYLFSAYTDFLIE